MTVAEHLNRAGLVVLLLISPKQEKILTDSKIEFTTDWNTDGADVEDAAKFIQKQSVYDGATVNGSEYI